jgi:predicted DNA-binding protein YlxM (UPF0122 family)
MKTVPGDRNGAFHILECITCGARVESKWNASTQVFTPMPCDCGDGRKPKIKVGDILNNKAVLRVTRLGPGDYEVRVKCLNCGRKSTLKNFAMLRGSRVKPRMWCERCKGESIQAGYMGQVVNNWKIIKEDMKWLTCTCLKCRDEITIARGHFAWLKTKPCHNCLGMQRKLTSNKIIGVLFSKGYSYDSISEYYGLSQEAVRDIVKKVGVKYQSPEPPSMKLTRNKIIKVLHSKGYSYDSIADYYRLSKAAIRNIVKKVGKYY